MVRGSAAKVRSWYDWLVWRAFHRRLRHEQQINEAFDRRHGTDTASEVSLESAGVPQNDATRGNNIYRPLWEGEFRRALASISIDFAGYTFVDIGSGKGKLLLLASEYPFHAIIGVEYAPLLNEIAIRNIETFSSKLQRCYSITSVASDALEYELPPGPIVCFIFNSFDDATMERALRRISSAVSERAEPGYVLYANVRRVSEMRGALASQHGLLHLQRTRTRVVLGNEAAGAQWDRTHRRRGVQTGIRAIDFRLRLRLRGLSPVDREVGPPH